MLVLWENHWTVGWKCFSLSCTLLGFTEPEISFLWGFYYALCSVLRLSPASPIASAGLMSDTGVTVISWGMKWGMSQEVTITS